MKDFVYARIYDDGRVRMNKDGFLAKPTKGVSSFLENMDPMKVRILGSYEDKRSRTYLWIKFKQKLVESNE